MRRDLSSRLRRVEAKVWLRSLSWLIFAATDERAAEIERELRASGRMRPAENPWNYGLDDDEKEA